MIYITLGDPYSINIECLLKILPTGEHPYKIILIGSRSIWDFQVKKFSSFPQWDIFPITSDTDARVGLNFLNTDNDAKYRTDPEQLSSYERGKIALEALEKLRDVSLQGNAVLTGPIDKALASSAGFKFPGQTEYVSSLVGKSGIMVLAGPKLRVGLVTNHLPLNQVSEHITKSLVYGKLKLLYKTLTQTFSIQEPQIGVTGLNPHCGDGGLFGDEDQNIIAPAIAEFNNDVVNANAIGPIPADTAFFRGYEGPLDGILAMYHDQGLGPLKTVHFYDAVNITGGLPFLRTSPDHGPATDKYGSGQADYRSFASALDCCYRYLDAK